MLNNEIINQFQNAMQKVGLQCPAPIVTNTDKFQRFGLPEDKGKKPCWYILHILQNNIVFGAFGCWKRNILVKWCNRDVKNLSEKDKALYNEKQRQWQKEHEIKKAKAKEIINRIWQCSNNKVVTHPYLEQKRIKSFGLRLYKGLLLVPLYNADGELQSLQFISPNGTKRFKPDTCTKGCFFTIGDIGENIYASESYSTAATIHEATGHCVIVVFTVSNLLQVAQIIRKKHPNKEIIICSDNDAFNSVSNIGITKATEAAKAINARLAVPHFKDISAKPTDFNDLMLLEGLEAIKNQLNSAEYLKENSEETISRLAKLTPLEYDQVRQKEAEKLEVRVTTLDQEVKKLQKPSNVYDDCCDELETEVEPYHETVNGNEIALEIFNFIKMHVVILDAQNCAITLWIIGTYCFSCFRIYPKLLINSPVKRCGKTTLMQILSCFVHKKLMASNITASAVFRSIELWKPTLLIDEADTFLKNNEELRGIINSGHSKDSAFVLRVEGDSKSRTPKRYSTWSPMVIAMIKNPPDTIIDRSVIVSLKRKLPIDKVKKLKIDSYEQQKELRQKLKKFAIDNFEAVKNAKAFNIVSDNDRAVDNWQPLFAIAEILGGNWQQQVEKAFHELNVLSEDESLSTMLLADIKYIFEFKNIKKIHSEDLLNSLIALEDRPWAELRNGKPLTKNRLAKMLKYFGIKPHQVWVNGNKNGYELTDFQDTFNRYLSTPPKQNSRTLDPAPSKGYSQIQNSRNNTDLEFQNELQPPPRAKSRVLEFQKGDMEGDTDREVLYL